MQNARRDLRLDGIRGLAVLAVVLFHANYLSGGAVGVDVFFVLSGYLITGICQSEIDRTGALNMRGFLGRRARRLIPALALLLAVYAVLAPILVPGQARFRWLDIGAATLCLTNFVEAFFHPLRPWAPLGHTWSLGIEWQFYLAWPLALIAFRRWSGRAVAILGVWSLLTVSRAVWLAGGGAEDVAYFLTPFHITGLLLGAALALRLPKLPAWAAPLACAALAAICLVPHQPQTFWITLPVGELAAAALIASPPNWLAWRPLVWTGKLSYGIYLWHLPVWHSLGPLPAWTRGPALLPASLALAAISYFTVEAAARKRQPPSSSIPAAARAAA